MWDVRCEICGWCASSISPMQAHVGEHLKTSSDDRLPRLVRTPSFESDFHNESNVYVWSHNGQVVMIAERGAPLCESKGLF